jgi:hypothetical protein
LRHLPPHRARLTADTPEQAAIFKRWDHSGEPA